MINDPQLARIHATLRRLVYLTAAVVVLAALILVNIATSGHAHTGACPPDHSLIRRPGSPPSS
jgi:hypothetical protein